MQSDTDGSRWLVEGSLGELPPIRIGLVGDRRSRQVWDQLVDRYHYLGIKRPTGRRLRYLVYAAQEPIGAVG